MTTKEIFINNLKFYRKKTGLTQAQLATYIDKSFNYINGIECGYSFPPPEVIDAIADILKIKPVQLFDENGSLINVVLSDRATFIDNLAEDIYKKIRDEIKADIYSGIETSLCKATANT